MWGGIGYLLTEYLKYSHWYSPLLYGWKTCQAKRAMVVEALNAIEVVSETEQIFTEEKVRERPKRMRPHVPKDRHFERIPW